MPRRYFAWTLQQEISQTLSTCLRWLLQRVPFMTHFGIVLLAILGPVVLPQVCAFVLVAVHVVFLCCQTRTAYGMWACWRGVLEHSRTDWEQLWQQRLSQRPKGGFLHYRDVQHGIILPAYKEDVATLKETLDILASHPLAPTNYWVCLGMESREAGAAAKAKSLVEEYRARHAFLDIDFSLHPGNIVGEAAGKSSNVNWAARFLADRMPDISSAILTIMDADTAFAADFFLGSAIEFALAVPEDRARMMFVPPIIFDRNSHEVPIFTRATDIFWSCAGAGTLYPSSECKIPTSAYGVSMQLADFCGYWDAGPEAIGEDLHFFCKALFETKGNLKSVTIYSPASQCNVVGAPANGPIADYINDLKARWAQACRHLWGSLDWGYCWHRVLTLSFGQSSQSPVAYMAAMQNGGDSDRGSIPLSPIFDSRVGTPSSHSSVEDGVAVKFSEVDQLPEYASPKATPRRMEARDEEEEAFLVVPSLPNDNVNLLRRAFRFTVLLTRLYEAHLMVAHLFLMMFVLTFLPKVVHRNGSMSFIEPYDRTCTWAICMHAVTVTPFATTANVPTDVPPGMQPFWMMPDIMICALQAARSIGALGIVATVVMCIFHDHYHAVACTGRWKRSEEALAAWRATGSAGPVPTSYIGIRSKSVSPRKWPKALLTYTAVPAGLLYGILPLLYAQLHHLTTNKMTYVVSAKGKNVVFPVTEEVLRTSLDLRRSLDVVATTGAPRGRSSLHLARSRISMSATSGRPVTDSKMMRKHDNAAVLDPPSPSSSSSSWSSSSSPRCEKGLRTH